MKTKEDLEKIGEMLRERMDKLSGTDISVKVTDNSIEITPDNRNCMISNLGVITDIARVTDMNTFAMVEVVGMKIELQIILQ